MGFGRFPAMVCPWAENGTLTSYLKERHSHLSAVEILGLVGIFGDFVPKRTLIPILSARWRCFWPTVL